MCLRQKHLIKKLFLDFDRQTFNLRRFFQQRSQNRNLHVQKNFSRKDRFFRRILFFMMNFEFFGYSADFFSSDIKRAFYWSSGNFPGTIFWEAHKFANFLGHRSNYVQTVGGKLLGGLSKLVLDVRSKFGRITL